MRLFVGQTILLVLTFGLGFHGRWAEAAGVPAFPAEMRLEALPAKAPEPDGNPGLPGKIALGRLLFFDPVLSATRDVACATCHHPRWGWGDGRRVPVGVSGVGLGPARMSGLGDSMGPLLRNTPSLLNVGFNGLVAGATVRPELAPMFWDSRVLGLEAQVPVPMRAREEMRGDSCEEARAVGLAVERVRGIAAYREMFSTAFGGPADRAVTAERLGQAVAAFERSLVAADTVVDRYLRGETSALSGLQREGLLVFQRSGCIQCHGGPMFSDYKLHFVGVSEGAPENRRAFRTPTLRNLKHTAPYMHDGSLASLGDVLAFYEQLEDAVSETLDGGGGGTTPELDPLLRHLDLKADDFPALESFLEALSDGRFDRQVPERVPSGLPVPQ